MALIHQIHRRVLFVMKEDDALDHDNFDYDGYINNGFVYEDLKFKQGHRPTIFYIEQLTHRQQIAAMELEPGERDEFVVRCGLKKLDNIDCYDENNDKIQTPNIKNTDDQRFGSILATKWLESINLGLSITSHLSAAIQSITVAPSPLLRRFATVVGDGESEKQSTKAKTKSK